MCETPENADKNSLTRYTFLGICIVSYLISLVNLGLIVSNGIHMCKHRVLKPLTLSFYVFSLMAILGIDANISGYLFLRDYDKETLDVLYQLTWNFMSLSFWLLNASLILIMYQLTLCLQITLQEIDERQVKLRLTVASVAIGIGLVSSSFIIFNMREH